MKLLVEMEATGEVDTAAEAATVDTWLLVKELGVGNIVEESYEDETVAREMAASLFCSWVLFYLPAASDAALVELLFGGVGFSHGAVRRYVRAKYSAVRTLDLGGNGRRMKGFWTSSARSSSWTRLQSRWPTSAS